jgi:ribonucleoside-triphosphate reductase
MQLTELKKQLETEDASFHGNCHDCGVPVDVLCSVNENGELVISGGAVYNPLNNEQYFFKCDKCFQNDKVLRNWRPVETYSRVVGYIRPVSQWNKGKIEEFKQRKEFVVEETTIR